MTVYVRAYPAEPRVRPDWDKAACRDVYDPDLFFTDDHRDQDAAISICKECPIVGDCLRYAFQLHLDGVWGGTTQKKRAYMRRKFGA